jgi:PAS domain S-box-containing protein
MALINENLERLVNERLSDIIIPSHAQSNARAVLQNLPVGVIEIMKEGIVSQINMEAAVLLGCSQEYAVGINVQKLLPEPLIEAYLGLVEGEEYCGTATLNGSDMGLKGRRITGDGGEDIVLVLYAGEVR